MEVKGTYIARKPIKIVGFVMARMNSSRLWGKSMMPLGPGGYPLALHVYWRLKACCPDVSEVWFMPTDDPADKEIQALAESLHEPYFIRPERGWNMAWAWSELHRRAQADLYLVAEADSPFCDISMARRAIEFYRKGAGYVVTDTPDGVPWTAKCFTWSAGGIGTTPGWYMALYEPYADSQYLKETPGPVFAVHPELNEFVRPPVVMMPALKKEYDWYRPYHLSTEVAEDAIVHQIIYANLWKGPGPENIIDLYDVLAYLDKHPEVARYNAHVVDSVACQTASQEAKRTEEETRRYHAMWRAMQDPANRIQKCQQCGAYVGFVREEAGKHWFSTWAGVKVRGRANIKCGRCGSVREWHEDR